jgi:D-glycero-D-manno-heptose 1,7-bisphosphate phosphatase
MLRQAVILAGGCGTHPGDLARPTPTPLLPVRGRSFLDYLVWNLKRHGIRQLVFSVGALAEPFQAHFGDGRDHGIRADYVIEPGSRGKGGALISALPRLEETFLVLDADTLFDVNYLDLERFCDQTAAPAVLALRHVADAGRYGQVDLSADQRITGFRDKVGGASGLVNGGLYLLRRRALEDLPLKSCSLEDDLFPVLAGRGELAGKPYIGFFLDLGVPGSYQEAEWRLPAWRRKPAAFLDRDGVLNEERDFVHRPNQFAWVPGAPEAVKWLNDHGYLVLVVTNQSGIARGYFSEADFLRFTDWIQDELRAWGAHIDATYYCPHHPTEGQGGYRQPCECRKPSPGLFRRALAEWEVDVERSFALGDKDRDLLAAQAAGIRGERFQGGNLLAKVQARAS